MCALSKSKDLSVKDCIEHFVSFEATVNYHKAMNIGSSAIKSVKNNKKKSIISGSSKKEQEVVNSVFY